MLPLCKDMFVTVTMDEAEAGFHKILDYELFAASKEMIAKLKIIAKDQEVPVLDDWIVKTEKDKGIFTLIRTPSHLQDLWEEAVASGVKKVIGLYQEWL